MLYNRNSYCNYRGLSAQLFDLFRRFIRLRFPNFIVFASYFEQDSNEPQKRIDFPELTQLSKTNEQDTGL